MSDILTAMREFRVLDDKRRSVGLGGDEEVRWNALRSQLKGGTGAASPASTAPVAAAALAAPAPAPTEERATAPVEQEPAAPPAPAEEPQVAATPTPSPTPDENGYVWDAASGLFWNVFAQHWYEPQGGTYLDVQGAPLDPGQAQATLAAALQEAAPADAPADDEAIDLPFDLDGSSDDVPELATGAELLHLAAEAAGLGPNGEPEAHAAVPLDDDPGSPVAFLGEGEPSDPEPATPDDDPWAATFDVPDEPSLTERNDWEFVARPTTPGPAQPSFDLWAAVGSAAAKARSEGRVLSAAQLPFDASRVPVIRGLVAEAEIEAGFDGWNEQHDDAPVGPADGHTLPWDPPEIPVTHQLTARQADRLIEAAPLAEDPLEFSFDAPPPEIAVAEVDADEELAIGDEDVIEEVVVEEDAVGEIVVDATADVDPAANAAADLQPGDEFVIDAAAPEPSLVDEDAQVAPTPEPTLVDEEAPFEISADLAPLETDPHKEPTLVEESALEEIVAEADGLDALAVEPTLVDEDAQLEPSREPTLVEGDALEEISSEPTLVEGDALEEISSEPTLVEGDALEEIASAEAAVEVEPTVEEPGDAPALVPEPAPQQPWLAQADDDLEEPSFAYGPAISADGQVVTTEPPPPPPPAAIPADPWSPPAGVPAPAPAPAATLGRMRIERASKPPDAPASPGRVFGEHRVVIHTREGVVKRGTIENVDLSRKTFVLQLADGGREDVATAGLKAVFLMRAPGEAAAPPDGAGQHVRVSFIDGRPLDGRAQDLSDPVGFFLTPADTRGNTARVFVYRGALRSLTTD